jgi:hypothetical protein
LERECRQADRRSTDKLGAARTASLSSLTLTQLFLREHSCSPFELNAEGTRDQEGLDRAGWSRAHVECSLDAMGSPSPAPSSRLTPYHVCMYGKGLIFDP